MKLNLNFFEIAKGGKFGIEWVSDNFISLKCLFHLKYGIFWWKSRKFLNSENFNNMQSILKKRFDPFKRPIHQNGKAEDVPVVAGRLVFNFV